MEDRRQSDNSNILSRFASAATAWTGSTPAFVIAALIIIVWGITGPLFHYSDTWQLVINTGTTIITFLMVFLIQRTQNKDALAVQLKLSELVAAIDGAGGKSIFPRMWERMQGIVDGSVVVTLDETKRAMRLIAEKTRVIAEGAGALAVAAALSGRAGEGPIVAVISGGNIDLKKFAELIGAA